MTSPHLLIAASAGAGKTTRLTEHYLRLVTRGEDPATILATTFTRKAAGEIQARVLGVLARAATGVGPELARLHEGVDPALTPDRCAQLVSLLLRRMHRLSIMTIDSLMVRIARVFALELGLPTAWTVLDEDLNEDLGELAIEQAVRDADVGELGELVAAVRAGVRGASVHGQLVRVATEAHAAYLHARHDPEAWDRLPAERRALTPDELARAIDELARTPMPLTNAGKPHSTWVTARDRHLEAVRARDWKWLLRDGIVAKVIAGESRFSSHDIAEPLRALLRALADHACAELSRALRERNLATRSIIETYDRVLAALKDSRGAYGFDDVARRIADQRDAMDLERLYYRLDARYRHVLLDEFQDTSIVQFQMLEPLISEVTSVIDGERSLLCVGDVKQSLYAWRAAEPAIFTAVPRRWPTVHAETVAVNYRSAPIVLRAVDRVFAALASGAVGGVPAEVASLWHERFQPHTASGISAGHAGAVTLRRFVPDADGAERGESEVRAIVERVEEIHRAAPRASVAVLMRRKSLIARIIRALGARGIEASEEGGNPLTDSPAVAAALALLRLADAPGDAIAACHVAISPLGERLRLRDPRDAQAVARLSAAVRRRLAREGYERTLSRLRGRCARDMDAAAHDRFDQLVRLAREHDARGGSRPGEFVRLVQRRRVESPRRLPVRVMTIHAAKGLEFDAVVLADLARQWRSPTGVIVDRPSPLEPVRCVTWAPPAELRKAAPELAGIVERAHHREVSEEWCALYVAMTRARHALEMLVPEKPKPPSTASALVAVLGAGDDDTDPVLWSDGDGAWTSGFADPAPAPGAREAEALDFRARPAQVGGVTRVARRSPARARAGGTIDLASTLSLASPSAERGLLLHAWFEAVRWLDEGAPSDEALRECAARLGFSGARARELLPEFHAAIARPALRGLLSRTTYAARTDAAIELHVERPFAVVDAGASASAALLSGRFDRVVVGRRGSEVEFVEIIDYKTERLESGPEGAARAVEAHREQLAAYARAASILWGAPPDRVSTLLAMTESGAVIPVDVRGALSPGAPRGG